MSPTRARTRGELLGIRERSRSFEQVSTIDSVDANLEYAGEMEHVAAASVSDDFLPLLGVRPALGRMLDSRVDVGKQQALAILISDELWRRRFAADPGVIGRAVRINDADMQIAGVLPPGFRLFLPPSVNGVEQIDVWLPDRIDRTVPYRGVPLLARLRSGVTLDQANAELQMLAAQFERENPDFYSGAKGWQASPFDRGPGAKVRFTARLLHDTMTRDVRPALFLLSGAVGVCAPDCFRERRESDVGAGFGAAARVGDPAGAGRRKNPNCPAAPFGKPRARAGICRRRTVLRALRARSDQAH